jgi:hypothetical protein
MSDHRPLYKKQKLNTSTEDVKPSEEYVETGSHEYVVTTPTTITITAAPTSAVTALALLSDMIIFSGHRDGTICRWNLLTTTTTDQNTQQQQQQQQQLQPNCQLPEWMITSACVNLTNHEIYGNEEKLGIAGLVVRQNRETLTASMSSSATTSISAAAKHFLYSWNHQREDMRIDINGIPQKVMIWDATTSERLSALMIDVGRCCHTKMYANPLISCLVFCKLLVDESTKSSSNSNQSTTVKVWTDAVIVALQATCEATAQNDNNSTSTSDTTNAEIKAAVSTLPVSLSSKRSNTIPTGNIVPFYEQTRKRMSPWMTKDGFVRAMAVVCPTATSNANDNQNISCNGYIVSITETTRHPIIPQHHQQQQQQEKSETDSTTATISAEESEGINYTPSNDGGQASSIILWDTANPGTMLHIFSLDGVGDRTNSLCNQRFAGSVYALTLSHCNQYLLLSTWMELSSSNRHLVLRLPSTTGKSSTDGPVDDSKTYSVCSWCSSSEREIAPSCQGGLIVSTSLQTAVNESTAQHILTMYSFQDLWNSTEHLKLNGVELNATQLPPTTQMRVPAISTTAGEPTSISLGRAHVIIGYENGTTSSSVVPESMKGAGDSWNIGSNEYVSCSTAPLGLRDVPCPHLSVTANNINLQNKCVIS